MGLESHAPVPFLDKATSSITPSPCRAGTDDALLHHCLPTRQNVMFIQGFGGEKERKQAKAGTIQVPEYVSGAMCNLGVSACCQQTRPQAGHQKCPYTSISSESCFGPPDKRAVLNISPALASTSWLWMPMEQHIPGLQRYLEGAVPRQDALPILLCPCASWLEEGSPSL